MGDRIVGRVVCVRVRASGFDLSAPFGWQFGLRGGIRFIFRRLPDFGTDLENVLSLLESLGAPIRKKYEMCRRRRLANKRSSDVWKCRPP